MIHAATETMTLTSQSAEPQDWADEVELKFIVSPVTADGEYSEKWYEEMEAHAHEVDPADIDRLLAALDESKKQQKALMARKMGLPE